MPEGIKGMLWAFCWGVLVVSGGFVGAILGITMHLRHRPIAAFMSLGEACCFRLPLSRPRPRHSCWPERHPRQAESSATSQNAIRLIRCLLQLAPRTLIPYDYGSGLDS